MSSRISPLCAEVNRDLDGNLITTGAGAVVSGKSLELFVLAALPLVFFPGPSVAFIVTSSLRHGTAFGVRATAGVEVGYLVHVFAAVVGVSALLAASTVAFSVVKVAGAVYLLWLAINAWRGSRAAGDEPAVSLEATDRRCNRRRPFRQGLIVGSSNPKTALFFLAFLPQFASPSRGPVAPQVLLLGLVFILLACVPDFSWAFAAGKLRRRLGTLRRKIVERVSAAIYVALALVVLSVDHKSS
jgi:threonine/homoserine/homoserine lactone efflux protein